MGEELSIKGKPILSEEHIRRLLSCTKYLPDGVRRLYDYNAMKPKNGNYKHSMKLHSDEGDFTVAIRQLIDDPLAFSVVLMYESKGYRYILTRYNGDHGRHYNPMSDDYVEGCHIHRITEECQRSSHKDECFAEATDRYRTLEEAVRVFMQDVNVVSGTLKGVCRLEEFA